MSMDGIRIRFQAQGDVFSVHIVQTESGVQFTSLLSVGYLWLFRSELGGRAVKGENPFRLVPRLRVRGAIPPHPNMYSWRDTVPV